MEIREQKAAIRKSLLAQRKALHATEKAVLDVGICSRLEDLILEKKPAVIHSYLPFEGEIDIVPLLQKLLEQNITIVCPRSLPKRQMENLVLNSLTDLEEGRFGTLHPAGGNVYTGPIDFFIVPGIGFNRQHYRLGFGAGYYDTFFASHPDGYKVGVCYPFQICEFPVEAHDVPLDEVIY